MKTLYKSTSGLIQKDTDSLLTSRIVAGKYTDDKIDLHGHLITREAMERALPAYREWGTVRLMHEDPIGTLNLIGRPEWNDISVKVSDTQKGNEVLQMTNEGIYKAFSVGILVTDGHFIHVDELEEDSMDAIPQDLAELFIELEYIFAITGLMLIENSIVDRPANPGARMKQLQSEFSIDGILPEINFQKGLSAIKGAVSNESGIWVVGDHVDKIKLDTASTGSIVITEDGDSSVENSASTEIVPEEIMEQETPTVVEDVILEDETVLEEEQASDEVEKEEIVETELVVDSDFEKLSVQISDVLNGINENNVFLKELKESIETFTALFVEVTEEEDIVAEEVDNSIESDEDAFAEKIADLVLEKITIAQEDQTTRDREHDDVEDEVINIKTLDKGSLSRVLALNAIARARS